MRADGRTLHRKSGYGPSTKPATLAEIGRAIGLTRERTRQIQRDALDKCTLAFERYGLTRDDLLLGLARLGVDEQRRG